MPGVLCYPCLFCEKDIRGGIPYGDHRKEHIKDMSDEELRGWLPFLESAARAIEREIDRREGDSR